MNVLLGVSGSVAAYRAADLARELMRRGHVVRTCLTDAAQKFVQPALFEALTGQPCLIDAFEEPDRGRMAHIDWARWANVVVIAPATANTIAKIAHGVGDDMLTTIAIATTAPLLVAPAMNPSMYGDAATQAALDVLRRRAFEVVEPVEGDVACGESGQGKLASIERIVESVARVLGRGERLRGWKVLITSGPTQEPIDVARFLTNRSSGKMGSALARAAALLGADVTVVAGPQSAPLPQNVTVVKVRTALEMLEAAKPLARTSDLIIGVAAVADYRPANRSSGKIRRTDAELQLELTPNPDVIRALAETQPNATVVGFAAEPNADVAIAREKLERKGLYALAANDVANPEVGFESEDNELTLTFRDGRVERSGRRSKLDCAFWLIESIVPERSVDGGLVS